MLIDNWANVNLADGEHETALTEAAFRGDSYLVKMLYGMGARINLVSGEYGSPLATAAHSPRQQLRARKRLSICCSNTVRISTSSVESMAQR